MALVGRVGSFELKRATILTFGYPDEVRHLVPPEALARFKGFGLTTGRVVFFTAESPSRESFFERAGEPGRSHDLFLKPDRGDADAQPRAIVEFLRSDNSFELPTEMLSPCPRITA